MPSQFTDNLNLEKQATGENSNTWGTKLNDLIDQLDRSIAGRLTKSVAGGVDVTLTVTEYENRSLEFTGILTANIDVIFPAIEKEWQVHNNTTGAFTLGCKTSAGTGITVPQGEKAKIEGDGTNIILFLDTAFSTLNDIIAARVFGL